MRSDIIQKEINIQEVVCVCVVACMCVCVCGCDRADCAFVECMFVCVCVCMCMGGVFTEALARDEVVGSTCGARVALMTLELIRLELTKLLLLLLFL